MRQISNIVVSSTEPKPNTLWIRRDDSGKRQMYIFGRYGWEMLGSDDVAGIPDDILEKIKEIEGAAGEINSVAAKVDAVEKSLAGKADASSIPDISGLVKESELKNYVEKEDGKALSTNDFTDELKIKLEGLGEGGDYTLPAASKDTLGGIKVGKGLSVAADGTLTADAQEQDLSEYALKSELPDVSGLAKKSDIPDTTNLVTKEEMDEKADKSDIPDIANLATKEEVDNKADKSDIPDIANLATKEEVDKKADKSDIPDLGLYALKSEMPDVDGKVDKEDGKGLSANDFSDEYKKMLEDLYDKSFPISFSVSGGGEYAQGTSKDITVSWSLKQNGATLVPDSVTINGVAVDNPSSGSKVFEGVTTSTTYSVVAKYKSKSYTGSAVVTFKGASETLYKYHGGVAESVTGETITSSDILALESEEATSKTATYSIIIEEQKYVYAYPASLGKLSSIKDNQLGANQLPGLYAGSPYTVDVNGVSYYVYMTEDIVNLMEEDNYEWTFA